MGDPPVAAGDGVQFEVVSVDSEYSCSLGSAEQRLQPFLRGLVDWLRPVTIGDLVGDGDQGRVAEGAR